MIIIYATFTQGSPLTDAKCTVIWQAWSPGWQWYLAERYIYVLAFDVDVHATRKNYLLYLENKKYNSDKSVCLRNGNCPRRQPYHMTSGKWIEKYSQSICLMAPMRCRTSQTYLNGPGLHYHRSRVRFVPPLGLLIRPRSEESPSVGHKARRIIQ